MPPAFEGCFSANRCPGLLQWIVTVDSANLGPKEGWLGGLGISGSEMGGAGRLLVNECDPASDLEDWQGERQGVALWSSAWAGHWG
jgi:hypothetical protein